MVADEQQEKAIENINKINEYLTGLGIFSGNAGLNHIVGENHKVKEALTNKKYKDAIEIVDSTIEYIHGLQWFPGNAALMWSSESLEKTRTLISGIKPESESNPDYDEPNPKGESEPTEEEKAEPEITEEMEADLIKGAVDSDESE